MVAVLVPIADDSEEIETSCITDVLVRAGIEVRCAGASRPMFPGLSARCHARSGRWMPEQVTVASVMPEGRLQCKMARGLKIVADVPIAACVGREWDAIALPGGMPGAKHLSECAPLVELLKAQAAANKTTGAVCAAPAIVLAAHGCAKPSAAGGGRLLSADARERGLPAPTLALLFFSGQ